MLPRCSFSVQKPHRSPPMLPANKIFCSIKSKISDSLQAAFCINFEWRPLQPVKICIEGMGLWQRGAHGLPKVSLGPAMLDLSMPCGKATAISGVARLQGQRLPAVFCPFGHPMLYVYDKGHLQVFDWVKEYFKTCAYGKVWLWTLLSNARACHALPFYALTAISGVATCREGGLQLSSISLDTSCRTP